MNSFIEQNKRLLLFYYWAARIGGWVFLSYAFLAIFGHSVALGSRFISDMSEFHRYWQHDVPWGVASEVLPTGLLILGVSQLIWYLLETGHKAGWVLRNTHQLQHGWRDRRQVSTRAQPLHLAVDDQAGHRVVGMLGVWFSALRVDHFVAVAVVGGE